MLGTTYYIGDGLGFHVQSDRKISDDLASEGSKGARDCSKDRGRYCQKGQAIHAVVSPDDRLKKKWLGRFKKGVTAKQYLDEIRERSDFDIRIFPLIQVWQDRVTG
jgi:hypothetical protein